jgi:hypothetical protein
MSGKTELLIIFSAIIGVGLLLNISLVLDRIETLLKECLPKK